MGFIKYSILVKHVFSPGRFVWRRCSNWTNPLNRFESNQTHDSTLCPCFLHTSQTYSSKYIKSLQWYFSRRTFSGSAYKQKNKTQHPGHDDDEEQSYEDEEDCIEEEEVEEIFQQQRLVGIGDEDHQVFIVHPDVKWGHKKQYLTTGTSPSVGINKPGPRSPVCSHENEHCFVNDIQMF